MKYIVPAMTELRIRFARDEEGATMVEYGLLVALIAAVVITIVVTIGDQLLGGFTDVSTELNDAGITGTTP